MTDIRVQRVDERDSGWERSRPRFRVYLHGSDESTTHGWTDTYDITGADVLQVIDWAQRQAGDALTYAVALVYDDEAEERLNPGHSRGLVWLGWSAWTERRPHGTARCRPAAADAHAASRPGCHPAGGPDAAGCARPLQRRHRTAMSRPLAHAEGADAWIPSSPWATQGE